MKLKLIAVTSANGKLTRGDDPDIYKWTSKEDSDFFFGEVRKAKLIVMGSATYEVADKLINPEPDKLRIVLTSSPEKFEDKHLTGQLEFSSESPKQLVSRLENEYDEMLLAGGAHVYSSFMKESLVDEIYLTIEPIMFGRGKNLFEGEEFEENLKLISTEKLNDRGTLLLKYEVLK